MTICKLVIFVQKHSFCQKGQPRKTSKSKSIYDRRPCRIDASVMDLPTFCCLAIGPRVWPSTLFFIYPTWPFRFRTASINHPVLEEALEVAITRGQVIDESSERRPHWQQWRCFPFFVNKKFGRSIRFSHLHVFLEIYFIRMWKSLLNIPILKGEFGVLWNTNH